MSSLLSNTAKPKYRFVNDPDGERISTLRARIGELEAENARLKGDAEGQTVEGGDEDERKWLVYYHDKDVPPELFVRGGNAEQCARKRHADQLNAWSCHLFREVFPGEQVASAAELTRLKAAQDFQRRVDPWLIACFGEEIARDQMERNHRFFEEAAELVQANGMTASEAHQLVDYTYGRPVGEASQEVGGVMVTLAALCLASGLDMHAAAETELARIWTKVEKIRAKQAAKPKHSPLPEHVPASSQPEHDRTVRLAALDEARLAVYGEVLTDCTGTPEDFAYNRAIRDAVNAIRSLIDQTGEGGI